MNIFLLITGAFKGQGFNHAKAFAEAGCDIAALDIIEPIPDVYALANKEMMEATVKAIEDRDQRCVALPCDIRDEAQVKAVVDKALEEFDGVIDVVVNNAGIAALDSITEMRSHVMDAVIDTIVKGHMYVMKYAVPNMIGRRAGKIISISSAVTGSGHAMLSHYVAAKHAINGLTEAWAMELSEFNINVNAIAPATIRPGDGQGSGMVLGLAGPIDMTPDAAYDHFSTMGNVAGDKWRAEMNDITDAAAMIIIIIAVASVERTNASFICANVRLR